MSQRTVLFSTTVFLQCGDEYLFLHRTGDVKVDKNRLNGIGGKLEEGENFLDCAIRETKEETGYIVIPKDVLFNGIVKLEGGYPEDWVMCFFTSQVPTKEIPHGQKIREGELLWLHKDKVFTTNYELVDDLHYLWKCIVNHEQFFATTHMGGDEKVKNISISSLRF